MNSKAQTLPRSPKYMYIAISPLSIQDISIHFPTISDEFMRLYGSQSTGGLAPWRGPRASNDSTECVVTDLQQLALQRVVQVRAEMREKEAEIVKDLKHRGNTERHDTDMDTQTQT